ncbi:MAG: hypothetical protein HC893_11880 [Chloroflexaceae bacterium]|nr:hypothetical protein [Chloroflexaceae bacterium]
MARLAQGPLSIWALLGVVGGLMVMTREQLGLFLLLPAIEGLVAYGRILFGRANLPTGTTRAGLFGRLFGAHLLFLVCLIAAVSPQLLTYQILNGIPLPSSTVAGKLESAGGFSPTFLIPSIHPRHGRFCGVRCWCRRCLALAGWPAAMHC